jgi:hypothetical protein
VIFKTADILSPNIMAGPSNATPNNRSKNLSSRICSVDILDATKFEPQNEVSTVF